jgi:DNA-binding MltR family transcriptional regulator
MTLAMLSSESGDIRGDMAKKKKQSIANVGKTMITPPHFAGLMEEIKHTSDRTAAIVLSAWVEQNLEMKIIAALPRRDEETVKKLQERDSALSGFYSKIHLAFALGLIDEETRDNLDVIRRIRNVFAHAAVFVTFQTPEIAKEIEKLKTTTEASPQMAEFSAERSRFTSACAVFAILTVIKQQTHKIELLYKAVEAISKVDRSKEVVPREQALDIAAAIQKILDLKDQH